MSRVNFRIAKRFSFLVVLTVLRPKETDCYTWHDTMFVTLSRMRPTRAIPVALGSLSPETKRSKLRLFVLCGVESFPGAAGLLCGQRSYGTVCAHHKGALFFQDSIHCLLYTSPSP